MIKIAKRKAEAELAAGNGASPSASVDKTGSPKTGNPAKRIKTQPPKQTKEEKKAYAAKVAESYKQRLEPYARYTFDESSGVVSKKYSQVGKPGILSSDRLPLSVSWQGGSGGESKFSSFPALIARSMSRGKFLQPTPVQMKCWSALYSGTSSLGGSSRDILVLAPTGSGKTLAFLLPLAVQVEDQLTRLGKEHRDTNRQEFSCAPLGMVLAPTRELAQQIEVASRVIRLKVDRAGSSSRDKSKTRSDTSAMHTVCVYGGADIVKQAQLLTSGGAEDIKHSGNSTSARPGDWACSQCQAHVFASKATCFTCGAPKPEADTPQLQPLPGSHSRQLDLVVGTPGRMLDLLRHGMGSRVMLVKIITKWPVVAFRTRAADAFHCNLCAFACLVHI
jgi:hypothetical protein